MTQEDGPATPPSAHTMDVAQHILGAFIISPSYDDLVFNGNPHGWANSVKIGLIEVLLKFPMRFLKQVVCGIGYAFFLVFMAACGLAVIVGGPVLSLLRDVAYLIAALCGNLDLRLSRENFANTYNNHVDSSADKLWKNGINPQALKVTPESITDEQLRAVKMRKY